MKLNMRELEKVGENCTVYRAASQSRDGVYHYVVVSSQGNVSCSCEGFQFAEKCWHVEVLP